MNDKFQMLRIRRNLLVVLMFLVLFVVCGYSLFKAIEGRGSLALVFALGVGTLAGFFLSLLCFFSPYIRVDYDRVIVSHDLLRKDVLFFYDIHTIDFEDKRFIRIYHLGGLTRVVYRKFNAYDKQLILDFFREVQAEQNGEPS
jgi:hypothetical protein